MTSSQRNDELGDVVPFPGAGTSPMVASVGEVETAGPVLDGELLTDEQYRRTRRLAELAISRLPARWHDRDYVNRVRADLVRHAVCAPFRYPAAVTRGVVIAGRAWWAWVSVRDFYDAAKQAQQLAHRFKTSTASEYGAAGQGCGISAFTTWVLRAPPRGNSAGPPDDSSGR